MPKKKRLRILWCYPLTALLCAVGSLMFVLFYTGTGAVVLLNAPSAPASSAPTDPSSVDVAEPDSDTLIIETTPSPTPAPSMEGRLFPFRFGELWGYKNAMGQEVIEPRYLRALEFTKGLFAFVGVERNGKLLYGLITRSGVWALEPSWSNVRPYSEGLAAVEQDGKWGFINEAGKIVIPCVYREVGDFHNGRAAVREASTFSYIDPDGDIAVKAAYTSAGIFGSDMAFVEQDGKQYTIDKVGQKITSWGNERGTYYSEGFAVIKSGNTCSYYDTTRKRRFTGFEDARPFSGGMAAVKKDGLWGYINTDGVMAILPRFVEAGEFSQDRAPVRDTSGKWGYVDKGGVIQVPCFYDEAEPFLMDSAKVKQNGEFGIVNKKGEYFMLY